MKLATLPLRRVLQLGFGAAAIISLAVTAAGWWAARSIRTADNELLTLERLQVTLVDAVRANNELLLTSGTIPSRQACARRLADLAKARQQPLHLDATLSAKIDAVVRAIEAFGKMPKPSPDSDEAMIAYGKLSAQVDETLLALDQTVDSHKTSAAAHSQQLLAATLGAGAVALALVLACARQVLRRLSCQLGGEIEQAQALMQRVGAGDLCPIATAASPSSVVGGLAAMVQQLRASIGHVQQTASMIGSASGEIAAGSQNLSQRTEGAATSLQQTASAMTQLTATVTQAAEAARSAQDLATTASQVAERGGSVVGQVVETMNAIQASSQKIADIIGVIDGIAFQTNILALNAAVEAARAGDAGRGFAVVAAEVRGLAQRSAGAAREIKSLISASVERVGQGTELVSAAGATMADIVHSVRRVSNIIGEISHAASEQTAGIAQVSRSVVELDGMTQQNASLSEQSAAAAEALEQHARTLAGVVAAFRTGDAVA